MPIDYIENPEGTNVCKECGEEGITHDIILEHLCKKCLKGTIVQIIAKWNLDNPDDKIE